jgi:ribosomal protein S18 acetylase RimI-like enzyme
MLISKLLPARAASLVPLLQQLHGFHVAREPELLHSAPSDADLTTFLTDWLARDDVTALVAGPVSAPVGYLIYEIERRPGSVLTKPECRAMLHHICVDAHHRRSGVARALITQLKDDARRAGVDRIGTTFANYNTASAKLMAACGLTPRRTYASIDFEDL